MEVGLMLDSDTLFWDLFEDWSPWLFIIAGVAWLLTALFNGLSDLVPVIILILLTEAGSIALSASLVGFYPRLRDHAPRLALGGVI